MRLTSLQSKGSVSVETPKQAKVTRIRVLVLLSGFIGFWLLLAYYRDTSFHISGQDIKIFCSVSSRRCCYCLSIIFYRVLHCTIGEPISTATQVCEGWGININLDRKFVPNFSNVQVNLPFSRKKLMLSSLQNSSFQPWWPIITMAKQPSNSKICNTPKTYDTTTAIRAICVPLAALLIQILSSSLTSNAEGIVWGATRILSCDGWG